MNAWRDIADRLNQAIIRTYREPVTYTPIASGTPFSVELHFESAHHEIDTATNTSITTEKPHAYCRIEDLTDAAGVTEVVAGDMITAQGYTYEVVDGEKDGYGAIKIWLRRASL